MQPSSKRLFAIAFFTLAACGPGLARAPLAVHRPAVTAHFRAAHVAGRPEMARERFRQFHRFAFDGRHRGRRAVLFPDAGDYILPYPVPVPVPENSEPLESAAIEPTLALTLLPPTPGDEPPVISAPTYVSAQIGLASMAPRIIYVHPVTRQSRHLPEVFYGTQKVDRIY